MSEENNNWPPKYHSEHIPAGRTGSTNFDTLGLKGREDVTFAKVIASGGYYNNDIFSRIANIFIN